MNTYEIVGKLLCTNCGSDTELFTVMSDHEEVVCRECLDKYDENQCENCGEFDENCECMQCPKCNYLVSSTADCDCQEHDPDMHEVDYAWDWDGK